MFELINQRQNLCYLRDSNADISSLCKTAIESICSEIKNNDAETSKLIEILISIFIEIAKTKVSESEFLEQMNSYGFPEDKSLIIYQGGVCKKPMIENILHLNVSLPRFRSLEWRIQCKIASRSCVRKITPLICIKLYLDVEKCGEQREVLQSETNDNKTKQLIVFQTDPNNLLNLISSIEQALLIKKNNL